MRSKRGKTGCQCQAQKNLLPVACAEKLLLVASAGKQVAGDRRRKTCYALKKRENMHAIWLTTLDSICACLDTKTNLVYVHSGLVGL